MHICHAQQRRKCIINHGHKLLLSQGARGAKGARGTRGKSLSKGGKGEKGEKGERRGKSDAAYRILTHIVSRVDGMECR